MKLDRRRSLPTSQKLKVLEKKKDLFSELLGFRADPELGTGKCYIYLYYKKKKKKKKNNKKKQKRISADITKKKVAIGRKFIFRYLFT